MSAVMALDKKEYPNCSYLIRAVADLSGVTLRLTDLDVHVLLRRSNVDSADTLLETAKLLEFKALSLHCLGDTEVTHTFSEVRFDARISLRSPRWKLMLLRFRYARPEDDPKTHGWFDMDKKGPRVSLRYPKAHASGYDRPRLEGKAQVHTANVKDGTPHAKPQGMSDEDWTATEGARPLLQMLCENGPATDKRLGVKRLALTSYRTNSCRWLSVLTQHDAWARHDEPAARKKPPQLELGFPAMDKPLVFPLVNRQGAKLYFCEAQGLLGAAASPFGDREDWILDANGRLAPLGLTDLGGLVALTPMELRRELNPLDQEPCRVPVEQVLLRLGEAATDPEFDSLIF